MPLIPDTITNQQPPSAPINPDYPTADISDFISEMNQPKQDFNLDIQPSEEETALFDNAPQDPVEKVDVQMKSAAASASGKLFATVIDTALPATLAAIASAPAEHFKAAPQDRQELADALTEYMRLVGADIPPGMMVVILVLSIYGSKVPDVIRLRKEHKALQEHQQSQTPQKNKRPPVQNTEPEDEQ